MTTTQRNIQGFNNCSIPCRARTWSSIEIPTWLNPNMALRKRFTRPWVVHTAFNLADVTVYLFHVWSPKISAVRLTMNWWVFSTSTNKEAINEIETYPRQDPCSKVHVGLWNTPPEAGAISSLRIHGDTKPAPWMQVGGCTNVRFNEWIIEPFYLKSAWANMENQNCSNLPPSHFDQPQRGGIWGMRDVNPTLCLSRHIAQHRGGRDEWN